ncbi:MAG TPA: response regulator transcription factor [Chitinophagaceae bacterium]|nr:response regulator transcription factor [Chitinophagaceae bacterium]
MKIPVGIVDDHQLFLKSLGLMLSGFDNYTVTVEALNGKDLQQKIQAADKLPEIILLDVNMPVMGGIETAVWLCKNYPDIKIVALSMNDNDNDIIGMIRAGCCAYLLKDIHPTELEKALGEINAKGYYNADAGNINYRRLLMFEDKNDPLYISDKERQFLKFACHEMSYKQIADAMNVSERTVDGYRESLFVKLGVHSRIGLILEAIKRELVKLE